MTLPLLFPFIEVFRFTNDLGNHHKLKEDKEPVNGESDSKDDIFER